MKRWNHALEPIILGAIGFQLNTFLSAWSERARSVKASASGSWSPEATPLAAEFEDGRGVLSGKTGCTVYSPAGQSSSG